MGDKERRDMEVDKEREKEHERKRLEERIHERQKDKELKELEQEKEKEKQNLEERLREKREEKFADKERRDMEVDKEREKEHERKRLEERIHERQKDKELKELEQEKEKGNDANAGENRLVEPGALYIRKIVCSKLAPVEIMTAAGDSNDPYVQLRYGASGRVHDTKAINNAGNYATYNDLNMHFHEEVFEEDLRGDTKCLHVSVYDKNTVLADTLIGECEVPLGRLLEAVGSEQKLEAIELYNNKNESTGLITIWITLASSSETHQNQIQSRNESIFPNSYQPSSSLNKLVEPNKASPIAKPQAYEDSREDHAASGYVVGDNIEAQYKQGYTWFPGKITAVNRKSFKTAYDIRYDDDDFEEGVFEEYIRKLRSGSHSGSNSSQPRPGPTSSIESTFMSV